LTVDGRASAQHDARAMFGRRHREEAGLSAAARAEVLAAEAIQVAVTVAPSPVVENTEQMWKLRLRVTPEDADPFDVDLEQALPQLEQPRAGQKVMVRFDPEDHSRVVLDRGDSGRAAAIAEQITSRLDPQQEAMLEKFTGGSVQDLISEAMADPQGFAARMQERARAAQKDAMAQADGAMAHEPPEDPVDLLARLADLHDRGVLTDEEFQAQKKRILGEWGAAGPTGGTPA
jgi:hypothetical protein